VTTSAWTAVPTSSGLNVTLPGRNSIVVSPEAFPSRHQTPTRCVDYRSFHGYPHGMPDNVGVFKRRSERRRVKMKGVWRVVNPLGAIGALFGKERVVR
jgi:hypothetical protein